jgi:hypothetical protein
MQIAEQKIEKSRRACFNFAAAVGMNSFKKCSVSQLRREN